MVNKSTTVASVLRVTILKKSLRNRRLDRDGLSFGAIDGRDLDFRGVERPGLKQLYYRYVTTVLVAKKAKTLAARFPGAAVDYLDQFPVWDVPGMFLSATFIRDYAEFIGVGPVRETDFIEGSFTMHDPKLNVHPSKRWHTGRPSTDVTEGNSQLALDTVDTKEEASCKKHSGNMLSDTDTNMDLKSDLFGKECAKEAIQQSQMQRGGPAIDSASNSGIFEICQDASAVKAIKHEPYGEGIPKDESSTYGSVVERESLFDGPIARYDILGLDDDLQPMSSFYQGVYATPAESPQISQTKSLPSPSESLGEEHGNALSNPADPDPVALNLRGGGGGSEWNDHESEAVLRKRKPKHLPRRRTAEKTPSTSPDRSDNAIIDETGGIKEPEGSLESMTDHNVDNTHHPNNTDPDINLTTYTSIYQPAEGTQPRRIETWLYSGNEHESAVMSQDNNGLLDVNSDNGQLILDPSETQDINKDGEVQEWIDDVVAAENEESQRTTLRDVSNSKSNNERPIVGSAQAQAAHKRIRDLKAEADLWIDEIDAAAKEAEQRDLMRNAGNNKNTIDGPPSLISAQAERGVKKKEDLEMEVEGWLDDVVAADKVVSQRIQPSSILGPRPVKMEMSIRGAPVDPKDLDRKEGLHVRRMDGNEDIAEEKEEGVDDHNLEFERWVAKTFGPRDFDPDYDDDFYRKVERAGKAVTDFFGSPCGSW